MFCTFFWLKSPLIFELFLSLFEVARKAGTVGPALQVPRCTKGAHPIQSYWQIQREISFNLVF